MAKVIGPLHSSEARGRVGGLIFNTWRGSATVKAKHAPAQPGGAAQLQMRANASMLARYWGSILDAVDRATWTAYAVAHVLTDWTGSTKRLTGLNWFLACSARLLMNDEAIVHTAPLVAAPDPPTGVTAVGGSSQITLSWDTPTTAPLIVWFYIQGPRSPGRIPTRARAKFRGNITGDDLTFVISGLTPGTHDIWVAVMDSVTGLVSTEILVSAVVTI